MRMQTKPPSPTPISKSKGPAGTISTPPVTPTHKQSVDAGKKPPLPSTRPPGFTPVNKPKGYAGKFSTPPGTLKIKYKVGGGKKASLSQKTSSGAVQSSKQKGKTGGRIGRDGDYLRSFFF